MRFLKILLPLVALLFWSVTAKADYNPANPPEPGVNFTLTTRCEPANAGYNLTQSGVHAFGSSVYLNVRPNTGFRFIGWEDEEGNKISTSQSFTYTMPSHDVTVTARFVYDPSNPEEPSTPVFKDESEISFEINPSGAGYFSNDYKDSYEVGTTHNFYVNAYSDYRFLNWTRDGEVVGTDRTLSYTVPKGDHTLTANFEYTPASPAEPGEPHFYRTLTLQSNPKDAASSFNGQGEHTDGSRINVSAYRSTGYIFINWTDEEGNVVSENSSFSYTMPTRDVTLTANYYYDPSNPGEPGIPNPGGSVGENMVLWPRFGMYDDTHVQILCETPGSTIHYTLDGTDPTSASPVYTEPVYVSSNLLVKAIAFAEGMENSPIVSYRVTAYHAATPVYTFENRKIKISSETEGAVIRYTLDFSEPNAESPVYTEPFEPEENCRIKAYASKEGLTDSPVSIYVYRRADHTLPAPTFELNDEGKLVINPPVSGGVTRYTTDGTDPDSSSTEYSAPLTISHNCIVKAYTTHINYFDSPIGSYEFNNFSLNAPAITFENKRIKIICDREDAVIRYTLDGSEPTEESTVYTAPFLPENDCTVNAYAAKENFNDSPVANYVFVRAEHTLAAPTISLNNEEKVVITSAIEDGVTRYTIDGTDPNAESAIYTAPIEVPINCIVKAYTTHPEYFDSPVATYVMPNIWEAVPVIEKDFRNRTITISQQDGLQVAVTIDGNTEIFDTPTTINVTPSMTSLSVIALTKTEGKKDSDPVSDAIVFHRPPVLAYDGHAVHYRLADDEPQAEGAEGWAYFNDNLRQYGEPEQSIDVYEFGKATAHIESDRAFRSDDSELPVDFFNTGRMAGARNGHRLSEAFGTWGDTPEDYTYLRVIGEVEKEDLQFIATLSALTTLHLDPYSMTEEECDGVFAKTRIETLFSTAFPEGMLWGMPRLTTLMWGLTNAKMPEGKIMEAGNPNILFWVTDAANAPEDARNVVVYDYIGEGFPTDPEGPGIEGRAENITLIANYPFNAHRPVTVDHAVVVKEFSQPTRIGVCQGWETIALPFEAQRIMREDGREIVPFEIWDGQDASPKPFWLYSATPDDWQQAGSIQAGVPYIISMPNNPDYIEDYNISGIVGFSADNVTLGIEESAPKTSDWKDGMLFKATFMPTDESGMLSLNTHGEGGLVSGSAFVSEASTLPFGAYVTEAGSRKAVPVFGDSGVMTLPSGLAEGLAIDASTPGVIRVSSMSDRHITVHDLTGAIVARTEVRAGESVAIEGLTGGVYLVAGQKVMVR